MKHFLLILAVIVLAACPVLSQEVDNLRVMDSGVLYWDASNTVLLPSDVESFDAFSVDATIVVDYQDEAALIPIGSTALLQIPFDFSIGPRLTRYLGVRARVTSADGTVSVGPIAWSFEVGSVDVSQGTFAITPEGGILLMQPITGIGVQ
jgi:hypothetical protein